MNVYEELNLKRVINASGKMTPLGTSIIDEKVGQYMNEAAMNYVNMDALIDRAGQIISGYTGAQDACVTSCASAGITISTAACIAKDNLSAIEALPLSSGMKNEIILQKGHSISFGVPITQMIRLGGGVPVEAGQANRVFPYHIEGLINEKTAALLYVKSHHAVQKGMVSLKQMIDIAKKHGIPLIVDAAAEEDIKRYVKMGVDLVIYSGAKALEGPTSGFITGREDLIKCCKLQYKGIARAMKIGKENIMGLLKAIELYSKKDAARLVNKQIKVVEWLTENINKIDGLTASIVKDEAGREIYRASMKVDSNILKIDANYIIKELESGNPSIYTRNHYANLGIIAFDPRPMKDGDEKIILERLEEIVNHK